MRLCLCVCVCVCVCEGCVCVTELSFFSVSVSGGFLQGAMQLARETEQKLKEAEWQCQDLTKATFEECRPCLEDTCKTFFTSMCRRGFTSFSFQV